MTLFHYLTVFLIFRIALCLHINVRDHGSHNLPTGFSITIDKKQLTCAEIKTLIQEHYNVNIKDQHLFYEEQELLDPAFNIYADLDLIVDPPQDMLRAALVTKPTSLLPFYGSEIFMNWDGTSVSSRVSMLAGSNNIGQPPPKLIVIPLGQISRDVSYPLANRIVSSEFTCRFYATVAQFIEKELSAVINCLLYLSTDEHESYKPIAVLPLTPAISLPEIDSPFSASTRLNTRFNAGSRLRLGFYMDAIEFIPPNLYGLIGVGSGSLSYSLA